MRRHRGIGSCVVFVLVALLTAAASATNHRFTESFNTKQYCDQVNTTALWDTVAGELRLPPCDFSILGAYDTPGSACGVAIDGDYAYVADGSAGLQIIDVTNLESPVLVGTYGTSGIAYGVFADGNHVYVADGTSGIVIVDVTNPATPTLTGSYNTAGLAYAVVVEGDFAYVADSASGLVVLNVTDPSSPTLAGIYNTPGTARGVAVAGNHAFVADMTSGLQIIDITDPSSPTLAASYATLGTAYDVELSGNHAYMAIYSVGLEVVDITNPASPAYLASLDLPSRAYGVDVSGEFAYVACYLAGLFEIDISNPSVPVVTRSLDTSGNSWAVEIDGNQAFVADYSSGLQIARINCPMPPQMEGLSDLWSTPMAIAVDGEYAYVAAEGEGVKVIDVSDPAAPVEVGNYATMNYCYSVAVSGDYLFAGTASAGVIVLNISNPASPALLGSYLTPGAAYGIAVSGDYAFVAAGSTGLIILNISNPATPTLLATCNTSGTAVCVALSGNYAFVGGGGYFRSINITNPASPTVSGACAAQALRVAIAGDYAFVVATSGGVSSIDISNPSSPAVASGWGLHGYDIAIAGNYAYIAPSSNSYSLQVMDITNPASITPETQLPGFSAHSVAVFGDYALVGDASGLWSIHIAQPNFLAMANLGQSSVVGSTDEPIVKVRLSSVQTDSIQWTVSANGGTNWNGVSSDWKWRTVSYPGGELLWRDYHYLADYPNNPTCSQLELEWLIEPAIIDSIRDIPGDQGGHVRVYFTRSGYDFADEASHPISSYYLWRRMDDPVALQAIAREVDFSAAAARAIGDAAGGLAPSGLPVIEWNGRLILRSDAAALSQNFPPGTWEIVGSAPGAQKDQYINVAPTLADSTVEDGVTYAVYLATAHTTTPSVWYASGADSGYSLDNLAPHVPTSFAVAYNSGGGTDLSWDVCPDSDFEYFKVYRGETEDFEPSPGNLLHMTIDAGWLDTVEQGYQYFYKIAAVDHAGNESAPAGAGTVTGAEPPATPKEFALHQNVPNPFNPSTRIRFDLPETSHVTLTVYNVSGQMIRVLADAQMPAGTREVSWDGRNAAGHSAASGIYFYRIDAGRFSQTKKMIMLR